MTRRQRLDAELVRRGLAGSRAHAADLVGDGRVTIAGVPATKVATNVRTDQAIVVKEPNERRYASRAAHKLLGALRVFEPRGLAIAGRRCLDAGASTGGFTDVLLERGAAEVVAVDVGYGQLNWRLRQDERVRVLDRTNPRALDAGLTGGTVDLAVADLSFISLTVVLGSLTGVCEADGDLVLMVKPQFEVGRGKVGKNGVVREESLHVEAVMGVVRCAERLGWGARGIAASPLPGPAGNVEYFGWFRTDASPAEVEDVRRAVADGPLSGEGD